MASASSLRARLRPGSAQQAAEVLAAAAQAGQTVRIVGGGTRADWGHPVPETEIELSSAGLEGVVEHNQGDLTAVLGAGTRVAAAQEAFAAAGQMLALDPPESPQGTVGGLVASADSGPMRHRHGAVRDLILGITVALVDGSVAHAGGKVIKNVAGYDLAKLFCGSFGTLGMIVEVVLRLHPLPVGTATAIGATADAPTLARAAARLARAPLELLCLDVAWQDGRGAVLARAGGSAARTTAERAARMLREANTDASLLDEDEPLWRDQRAAQRPREGAAVLRVSGLPSRLEEVLTAVSAEDGRMVGRAALGLSWLGLPAGDPAATAAAVTRLRERLSPSPCVLVGAPTALREAVDAWDMGHGPELELARRLRARFDPAGTCNPGIHLASV